MAIKGQYAIVRQSELTDMFSMHDDVSLATSTAKSFTGAEGVNLCVVQVVAAFKNVSATIEESEVVQVVDSKGVSVIA